MAAHDRPRLRRTWGRYFRTVWPEKRRKNFQPFHSGEKGRPAELYDGKQGPAASQQAKVERLPPSRNDGGNQIPGLPPSLTDGAADGPTANLDAFWTVIPGSAGIIHFSIATAPTVVLPVSSINAFVNKGHEASRLLFEGERVLEAGHVFSCSIKKLDKDCYTFIGFVPQISALTSYPYELETTLNGRNAGDISCFCKPG
ncbi:hypothetical protein HPB47_002783 [Ixodes persulcatus]|uniref:Uncharacterized protein n=1 Tax=Ixodes persulcatus TaxID=34615 RepID=A0AC60PLS0_IXOPE|nr:hypothetical protein HPB47_002783 [Ixodes persulcatus]